MATDIETGELTHRFIEAVNARDELKQFVAAA